MIYQGSRRTRVRGVILHCLGVPDGWASGRSALDVRTIVDEWHRQRGWNGIGYHAVFTPDGDMAVGRPYKWLGAHTHGHNDGTLGFVLVETKRIDHVAATWREWFTERQVLAVMETIRGIDGIEWVAGHNDFAAKLCPGFDVESDEWLGR